MAHSDSTTLVSFAL